jgi:LPXTG-motif cell wall-anchored protein
VKVRIALATLVAAGAVFALPATSAFAGATCGASSAPPCSQVVGTGGSVAPTVQPTVQPAVQASTVAADVAAPSGPSLPLTGGDVAGLSLLGVALLGGGSVLVLRTRTKRVDTQD